MSWIWVFLSFRGRLDAKRYEIACRILSMVCFLPALVLCGSDHKVRITAVFLPAIWPFLALAIKRLRDSERSAMFALLVMVSWLLAGAFFAGRSFRGDQRADSLCGMWSCHRNFLHAPRQTQ